MGEVLLDLQLYRGEGNIGVYWECPPAPPLITEDFGIRVRDHSPCCSYDEGCRWFESSY